ncbi:hypothetical protein GCM10007866_17380 [Gluconobacter albidus]|uniref:Uncharacterized protein n=1 Tax=Gluconobacter albidus TaxID=318683 RepID=A0ABQ5X1Y6_9PROT|nr:hypothetical protein AA3250_1212 [Gluconobacter albidus NBRC 3250]GLQ69287.1 hypothetical protein GCM10007866_17380 [Gluconobacter albidus]
MASLLSATVLNVAVFWVVVQAAVEPRRRAPRPECENAIAHDVSRHKKTASEGGYLA